MDAVDDPHQVGAAEGARWLAAADSLAANLSTLGAPAVPHWYRVGDACLALHASDPSFLERFSVLFGACRVDVPEEGHPTVEGRVVRPSRGGGPALVTAGGPALPDPAGFVEALFGDDGLSRKKVSNGWTGFAFRGDERSRLAVRGNDFLVSADGPWRYIAGAVLVHRAMGAQPDVMFVHAAAVRIRGAGVLFVGSRGTGKTTIAVGLAARGHALLSDEVGAIRFDGPAIVSFPRAAGVRPGPRGSAAAAVLDRPGHPVERFADGSTKTLVPLEDVGPTVPLGDPVPLEHIVVLDGRAEHPRFTALDPTPRNARYLAPVKSMPFSPGSASKTMRLITLASKVHWHRLRAGTPDETLTAIEQRFGNA